MVLVLRERRERLSREHAGHALDLRHDGLKEVLAGVRADAGHDVRISGRADDLLDLGDVLQRAHGLLRVRRPDEEVRVAGVTIFLTVRPILECRIAPEPQDVVHLLDLGRECAQLVRVTEAARDGDVVTPKDGLGQFSALPPTRSDAFVPAGVTKYGGPGSALRAKRRAQGWAGRPGGSQG